MIVFKVIILGDAGSGKTCLMNNYLGNQFVEHDPPTIGVEFGSRIQDATKFLDSDLIKEYLELSEGIRGEPVNELNAKVQLWGTSGQERFHSIVKSYYRNVNGCLFVCDLTRRRTFEHLKYWLEDFQNNSNIPLSEIGAAIIGNKTDLKNHFEVYEHDLEELAQEYNLPFFLVSSKNDKDKIENIFNKLTNQMFKKFLADPDTHFTDLHALKLQKNNNNKLYKQCCNIN